MCIQANLKGKAVQFKLLGWALFSELGGISAGLAVLARSALERLIRKRLRDNRRPLDISSLQG